MASLVQDTGKILSFEPNPNIFPYLLASTKLNGFLDRVTLHNLALSDAPGDAMLLFAAVTNNWGGSALNFKAENLQDHVNVEVRLETLNFIAGGLTRLDFIKIDVEGAEFLAMKGGADVLRRFKPTILSEMHVPQLRRVSDVSGEEYIALMQEFGYACFELLDGGTISTQAIRSPDSGARQRRVPAPRTSVVAVGRREAAAISHVVNVKTLRRDTKSHPTR